MDAYGRAFECVFVVLHPFMRVPAELAWSTTHRYPGDAEIAARGEKVPWTEVAARTSLKSCARINQALLTSIGSLDDHVADPAGAASCSVSSNPSPSGCPPKAASSRFSSPIFFTFCGGWSGRAPLRPRISNTDPVARLPLALFATKQISIPAARSRFAALSSRPTIPSSLRSIGTVSSRSSTAPRICRPRSRRINLEGFFATPNTEHAWYNYSFGCATVTLSPEHWQTM